MFSKIVVTLNDLPESQRALRTAIDLARFFDAALATLSILGDLPAYTSLAIVVDPGAPTAMEEHRRRIHAELHEEATRLAQQHGVPATGSVIEGREVQAILHFIKEKMRICLSSGCTNTISTYPASGVQHMTSHRMRLVVCSACIDASGMSESETK